MKEAANCGGLTLSKIVAEGRRLRDSGGTGYHLPDSGRIFGACQSNAPMNFVR
jgi:hypothetical protein